MTALPRWAELLIAHAAPERRPHTIAAATEMVDIVRASPTNYVGRDFCCGHLPSFPQSDTRTAQDPWVEHLVAWTLASTHTLPGAFLLDLEEVPEAFHTTAYFALERYPDTACVLLMRSPVPEHFLLPGNVTVLPAPVSSWPTTGPATRIACAHLGAAQTIDLMRSLRTVLPHLVPGGLILLHDFAYHQAWSLLLQDPQWHPLTRLSLFEIPTGHALAIVP